MRVSFKDCRCSIVDWRLQKLSAISRQLSAELLVILRSPAFWATKDLGSSFERTLTEQRNKLLGCFAALSMTNGYTIHHSPLQLAPSLEPAANGTKCLAWLTLPSFRQPVVVNIFPEASVLFELDYDPGLPPLRIDNKPDAIYVSGSLNRL